jgi:alpha-tubulin suppressor-like RCC1 family protein
MEGFSHIRAVAAGEAHSVLVKLNGTVMATGTNHHGQTGGGLDEPITEYFQAVKFSSRGGARGLKVVDVDAGFDHSLALDEGGRVWAWGGNASGQLGDGTSTDRSDPKIVPNLTGIVAIAAGDAFSVALDSNGRVFSWGNNVLGQLGDGTRIGKWQPVQIATLDAVQGIVAGGSHAMAVRADGGLWTWGTNDYGQLGEGPVTSLLPVPLDPPIGPNRVERLAENKNN